MMYQAVSARLRRDDMLTVKVKTTVLRQAISKPGCSAALKRFSVASTRLD